MEGLLKELVGHVLDSHYQPIRSGEEAGRSDLGMKSLERFIRTNYGRIDAVYQEEVAKILTVKILKSMEAGKIFATGICNDPRLDKVGELRWIAVRGGAYDWAIYYHHAGNAIEWVRRHGDKCVTKEVIRALVPCDDEAFQRYRY